MPAEDTYNAAAAKSDMIYQPLNLSYNVEFVAPGYVGDPMETPLLMPRTSSLFLQLIHHEVSLVSIPLIPQM